VTLNRPHLTEFPSLPQYPPTYGGISNAAPSVVMLRLPQTTRQQLQFELFKNTPRAGRQTNQHLKSLFPPFIVIIQDPFDALKSTFS
jgi:hypothetical protein